MSEQKSAREWMEDALGRYQVTHCHSSIREALKAMDVTENNASEVTPPKPIDTAPEEGTFYFYCSDVEAGVRNICTTQCKECADKQQEKLLGNNNCYPKPEAAPAEAIQEWYIDKSHRQDCQLRYITAEEAKDRDYGCTCPKPESPQAEGGKSHEHKFFCPNDQQQCDTECRLIHSCSICSKTRADLESQPSSPAADTDLSTYRQRLNRSHVVACNNPDGAVGAAGCICKVVMRNEPPSLAGFLGEKRIEHIIAGLELRSTDMAVDVISALRELQQRRKEYKLSFPAESELHMPTIEVAVTRILEQRCERGTPWDLAVMECAEALRRLGRGERREHETQPQLKQSQPVIEPPDLSGITYFVHAKDGSMQVSEDPYRRDYVSYQDFLVIVEALRKLEGTQK